MVEDFDAFFLRLYPAARSLAYRILGNPTAAEDAAAEAFARALAKWHRVARLPYRDPWVLRVATNVSLDVARKGGRTGPTLNVDADLAVDSHEDVVALRSALVLAMSALPRRQREAIALVYLAGLSPNQAAASMGVSASSVSQHTRRGLERLRSGLDDETMKNELAELEGAHDVEI
jgi:RNA polymerase sigma factor (sigma-70 family)